jgi:hypothetical protein
MATGRGTAPRLPDDELPVDDATLRWLLQGLGDMVLVGGQALAFWMDRFHIGTAGAAVTSDADALGSLPKAEALARRLNGRLLRPGERRLTALVAQIRLGSGARQRNIDVLHQLFTISGRSKSHAFTQKVRRRSVEVEWQTGSVLRVMHPLDVLASRAHNAVGLLDDKGPHVVTQLIWAVEVAREAMLRVLDRPDAGEERLGRMVQEVRTLALSAVGRRVLDQHGIELLDAIPLESIERLRPEHARQLAQLRAAMQRRRRLG